MYQIGESPYYDPTIVLYPDLYKDKNRRDDQINKVESSKEKPDFKKLLDEKMSEIGGII